MTTKERRALVFVLRFLGVTSHESDEALNWHDWADVLSNDRRWKDVHAADVTRQLRSAFPSEMVKVTIRGSERRRREAGAKWTPGRG
jgi:hypothetical protein